MDDARVTSVHRFQEDGNLLLLLFGLCGLLLLRERLAAVQVEAEVREEGLDKSNCGNLHLHLYLDQ